MKHTVKISSFLILIFSGIFLKADLQESDRNWIIEFAMNPSGWHEQDSLGWMWTAPESGQSLWFYMPDYQSWNWTGLDVYPFMWSLDHDWFYYLDGSQDPHYFYSYIRNRWIDGDHLLNYPLSYRLWPGFSRDSLYETVTPFEHADAQRSHLHTADFGGSLTHPALNVVNIRTFEGIHPTPYNVVTRDEDEVFMIGGTAGEDEGSVGPYVVKFDAWTGNVVWNVQLRNMRELGEFMWPGLVTAHGNGYIYAVAGSHIWKLDSETGEVLVEASLPAPVGADSEDIAYNGFTVLPDGTLVAKCFGRPAGCEAQGTLAFTECSGEQPPSLLVAINPENLEVIDLYQMSESSGGRITSSIYSDTQYLYVPGVENIIRLTWTGSQLLLDTGWEVADYVKPGQTPASAPVVMGDWIVFQTNYSISTAPLTVWAISQADSSNRLSIDPFGIGLNGRSIIPSALSVDPENMRIFAMDAMAQKIGAIDLIDGNRLEVRWIADQMTLSHTSLVGTMEERVLAATSIVDFQPGPGGMINYNERVVWRAADTGELLAQSDLLGPMAQGVPIAPGFFGVWYYLGLDGTVTELQIETRPDDLIREGFEISQFISLSEIKTWTSREITRAEFEALNPPQNWIINPVAEPDFDEGGVTRSPGASVDGDFVFEEHFGVEWMHNATTTEFNIPMDDEGLLKGNLISKHQVLTYYAGNTLSILISPDGEYYVRVIRVVDRTSEQPTLPMGWQQIENPLSDDLTIQLPNPVLAIIADNGDSFQGPFDPEALGLPSANADTDLDGLSDLWEIRYFNSIGAVTGVADSDDDGLSDLEEFTAGTNPLMADTDGDGVDDGTEIQNGTDPLVPDGATIMITDDGVQFVRTDESRFENLPDWPYDYKYVEIDGLRQAYAEAGPADGPVVLLLHGQPSWSYLYREMMPVLADAGYRVIAMDHLGCGRSDKPINIDVYSYLGHCDRLEQFIQILGLSDINLFGQDWGSLIGLRVAGMNPEWFASIAIGNGDLIREPAGVQLFAPVENPDEILDIDSIYGFIPDQQVPFFDGCELLYPFERGYDTFHPWAEFAMKSSNFIASEMLEALTYFPLTEEEEAAYDAPFPTRTHMAGIRVFPSLINEIPGTTDQAWEGLGAFEKPFLAIWGGNDPSTLGSCEMAEALIADIPGSTGQPHDRLPQASHFLQEDEGELIATRLVEFYAANGIVADPQTQKLGFEILEMKSLNEIVVWVNKELTEEEFNSIQLPNGWFKNQIRESDATSARFLRSPDATEDGPLFEAEHFGYTWQQNAVVVETGIQVDEQGLLEATRVAKYHELTYAAGKTVHILISPEGEHYIRIGRDANRSQEDPTIPENWQLVEHVPVEDIVIQLPNPTFNIRADNEDSFQGPLTAEEVGLGHDPEILMNEDGVAFVRTPESRFENLPDWPYDYKYVEIDGLRQAYAEAGPADGPVVLLLHGQPSWSYLYRKMIPILAEAGYRVIAMDHLGCGRSDKPIDIDDYTYLGHNDRLEKFILGLGLTDINLFVQDWGSLIGLRVAGLNPDWFATIGVGNGALPIYPAGEEVFPPVENPNEIIDLAPFYAQIPDQQVPFYDGCERLFTGQDNSYFGNWMEFAMKSSQFVPSGTVEAQTWFPVPEEVEAAYDAPFPSRIYMAGIRKFPSLVNEVPGTTLEAWAGLSTFEKPFITIWAANDAGQMGGCEAAEIFINNVPGATGQPHARIPEASHFLQDDQGEEIAARLVEFYAANGIDGVPVTKDLGFELFQAMSPNEIVVWFSDQITEEEFNAIDLPTGWFRSQTREGTTTSDRFLRSPGADKEGPLLEAELFGHTWQQNAILVESGIPMDDQGLLEAASVAKFHELTYAAGKTVQILISPEDEYYILVGRDANRTQEIPTIPDSWQLIEKVLTDDLVIQLPNPTLNIRADNEDSFQGPLTAEGVGLGQETDDPIERVGFEIHQIVSMNEIITWKSMGMTQAEFDAIELPQGWFKNQPRLGLADGGSFARSPDATEDGPLTVATHFGHEWEHVATIIETNIAMDDQGLLKGNLIAKYHTIQFGAGSALSILISPEGDRYVLVTRDNNRTSDTFGVPDGWQLMDFTTPQELIIPLPNPTMNIRTDNEDSYQGPLPTNPPG